MRRPGRSPSRSPAGSLAAIFLRSALSMPGCHPADLWLAPLRHQLARAAVVRLVRHPADLRLAPLRPWCAGARCSRASGSPSRSPAGSIAAGSGRLTDSNPSSRHPADLRLAPLRHLRVELAQRGLEGHPADLRLAPLRLDSVKKALGFDAESPSRSPAGSIAAGPAGSHGGRPPARHPADLRLAPLRPP